MAARLTRAILLVVFLFGVVDSTPPPAVAVTGQGLDAKPASGRSDTRGSEATVVTARPAPIVIPPGAGDDEGGSPLPADPSIGQRPASAKYRAPAIKTELPAERTEFTKTQARPDGAFELDIGSGRLNYQDAKGDWQPLDLSLVPDASAGYDLRVAASDRTVRFGTANPDAGIAALSSELGELRLRTVGYGATKPGAVDSKDNTLSFAAPVGSGTVAVAPSDYGFEFTVTLGTAADTNVYLFALDAGGLEPQLLDDGSISLLGQTVGLGGRPASASIGKIAAPFMVETPAGLADPKPVTTQLVRPGDTILPDGVDPEVVKGLSAGEVLLAYTIDPDWLADPARQFPVTMDPSVCIGAGQSGCSNGNFDEFIFSASPSLHASGWTVVRTGYDGSTTDGGSYAKTRGLFYFPDVSLPDGAVVYDTELDVWINSAQTAFGNPVGETVNAYRVNRAWATNSVSWNDMTSPSNGWDSSPSASDTVPSSPAGKQMAFDVDDIVRSWYTRRSAAWKPNVGFMLKFANEAAANGEVWFYKATSSTQSKRPMLTISYEIPKPAITFDAALGPTYAPSQMVAGQTTKLPLTIKNDGSGFDWTTANWRLGYRWFDAKGKLVTCPSGDCTTALGGAINNGSSRDIVLTVTPPSSVGQYTLRLDMVRVANSTNVWSSDWAALSKYYSRDKKVLTRDNTRWTGSSAIERDEFGINVVAGGGSNAGDLEGIDLADGSNLAVNLNSANLSYEGTTDLGFADLGTDLGLAYGYDSANVSHCTGVLAACGWYTNYDERIIPTGDGNYTYTSPDGDRYFVGTDGSGQLSSGAPVLLERQRFTLIDERQLDWTSGPTPAWNTSTVYTGLSSLTVNNADSASHATLEEPIPLERYPNLTFAVRSTSGSDSSGRPALGLYLRDNDDGNEFWFFYTFGSSSWQVGSSEFKWLDSHVAGAWFTDTRNVVTDLTAAVSGLSDDIDVLQISLRGDQGGGSQTLRYDDVRFDARNGTTIFNDDELDWTGGLSHASTSSDAVYGTASIEVENVAIDNSPTCEGCFTTKLVKYPFVKWSWKKAGGATIAVVFELQDDRSNSAGDGTKATGQLTYYAGPLPPEGAVHPIQVSPTLPTAWTAVTRNVLDDARQVLGFYDDHPLGTDPSAPPASPRPDPVDITGLALVAYDGTWARFDFMRPASATAIPSTPGANQARNDFLVSYRDESVHTLNPDGLLVAMADRDGNQTTLDWSYDHSVHGQSAYTLDTIHAPGDGLSLSSGTAQREIDVSETGPSGGYRKVIFAEKLGSGAGTGRDVAFWMASSAGSGGNSWAIDDVVRIKPARLSDCAASRPYGCTEFSYQSSSNHLLAEIRDPRWDGTVTGGSDLRHGIEWAGSPLAPKRLYDFSKGTSGAARLYVVSYNDTRVSGLGAKRVIWQDAAARSSNTAAMADLSPEGSILTEYIRQDCDAAGCSFNSATSYPASPTTSKIAQTSTFDGLAQVSSTTTYRCSATSGAPAGCTGSTALRTVERRGSNAAAKVDSLIDPLAAGNTAWTQSSDAFFASLRDSDGRNPDLYQTEYAYDAANRVIETDQPVFERLPAYPATVAAPIALGAYWRLGESSGDAADNGPDGVTATLHGGATRNVAGALLQDTNGAITLDGTSGYLTAPLAVNLSAYSIEAWFKVTTAGQTSKGIAGRWLSNSGAMLYLNSSGNMGFKQDATFLTSGVQPEIGRWYHLVGTKSSAYLSFFIDGVLVDRAKLSTAPGSGSSNFEIGSYGNHAAGTYLNGSVDEVAFYPGTLYAPNIAAHYAAGRAMVRQRVATTYDGEGHPLQSVDNFVDNGGFESATASWRVSNAVEDDANVNSGLSALKISTTGYARQEAAVPPGQTVRVQFAVKKATGIPQWTISSLQTDGTWQSVETGTSTATDFITQAYDVTLPLDSAGELRIDFSNADGTGDSYLDDVLVVSNWQQSTFATDGRLTDTYLLQPGGSDGATLRTHTAYAATTEHPAIFPTTVTANYVDGAYEDSARDEDLATTTTYDQWGRSLVSTDPSGITATTAYAANLTDVASTTDGNGFATTFTYDALGQPLTTTSPEGLVTTTTYDLVGHVTSTTDPAGVRAKSDYNTYNLKATDWANYRDGNADGADDDLQTTYLYDAYGNLTSTTADDQGGSDGIQARTTTSYDLLGNAVATTVYADSGHTDGRTTTNYFETYAPSAGSYAGQTFSLASATGQQPAIAPPNDSGSPTCPGSSAKCLTVTTTDFNGRAWQTRTVNPETSPSAPVLTVTDFNLAGQPLRTIANYVDGNYSSGATDTDVATTTVYDLAGRQSTQTACSTDCTDATQRRTRTTYDDIDRPIETATQLWNTDVDPDAFTDYNLASTVYRANGQVERVSDPAAPSVDESDRTWAKTEYDAGGRAVRTLAHYDIGGDARYRLESFEADAAGWATTTTNFITAAATSARTTPFDAVAPRAGGRTMLRVTPSGTGGGAWWDLAALGQPFTAGHAYRVTADLYATTGDYQAFLGVDTFGGSSATSATLTPNGSWTTIDFSWTPASPATSDVHFAVKRTSGSSPFILDNVQVWDTTAADANIPTETAYNRDGQVTESVLPPGVPGEAPMATTTAYDPAARPVSVSVNAADAYGHQLAADAGSSLVGYWPLDERSGTSAADASGGDLAGTYGSGARQAVAGAIDENRPAAQLDGTTNGVVTVGDTSALDLAGPLAVEFWARSDTLLDGSSAAGWHGGVEKAGAYTLGWSVGSGGVAGGGWRFAVTAGSQDYVVDATSTSVEPGRWYHVVGTYDGSALKLYVDGALANTNASVGSQTIDNSANALKLGVAHGTGWAGALDEVSVWSAALSSTQVTNHYAAGRRTATDLALTTRTTYDGLGRNVLTSSPRRIRTAYTNDRLGRLTATVANLRDGAASTAAGGDDVSARFAYDALGELIGTCSGGQVWDSAQAAELCDPASASDAYSWHYGYDSLGNRTSQVAPVNQSAEPLDTTAWTYDATGLLTTVCSFAPGDSCASAARHTDYTYDALGRALTEQVYAGAGTGNLKLRFDRTYAPDGSLTQTDFDGSGSSQGSDTLDFSYTPLSQLDQVADGSSVLTDYAWNPDGTLAARTDGDLASANEFEYDWAHRLTATTSPLWSGSATYAWRNDGLLASRSWPSAGSGGAASFSYDGAKRATALAKAGTAAASFSQAYDRDGNVTSEGRSLTGISGDAGTNTQSFTYDGLNRLTASSGLAATVNATYAYDRDGNRTSSIVNGATTTFSYDRTAQLISRSDPGGTTTFAYDAYGNQTSSARAFNSVTSYTYDLADRLTAMTLPGAGNSTYTFSLDALGRPVSRSFNGGGTDSYAYVGTGKSAWRAVLGGTTIDAGLGPDESRLALKAGASFSWLLPDLHGNIAAGIDSAETTVTDAWRYDGYGRPAAGVTSGVSNPWGYQGRLAIGPDPANPFYAAGARAYDPDLGTFTQLDSVAGNAPDPLSLNRYLYAEGNPATLIDPTGHFPVRCADKWCSANLPTTPPTNDDNDVVQVPHQVAPVCADCGQEPNGGGGGTVTPNHETPVGQPSPGEPTPQPAPPPNSIAGKVVFKSAGDEKCARGAIGAVGLGTAADTMEGLALALHAAGAGADSTIVGLPVGGVLHAAGLILLGGGIILLWTQCT